MNILGFSLSSFPSISEIFSSMPPKAFDAVILTVVTVVAFVIDFFFCGRKKTTSVKASVFWTIFWFAAAFAYSAVILTFHGPAQTDDFIAGYILERILSVDNIFVFVMILSYFKVPSELHQRVLFFGIVIALILRGIFIVLGGALVEKFAWTMYVFGAFLLFTGLKLLFSKDDDDEDIGSKPLVKFLKSKMRFSSGYHGTKLVIKDGKQTMFTMLCLVMIVIAISDVIFAVDSIPAIFAITTDSYIVFAANVFSVLGLRSIFFIIEAAIKKFSHLKYALSVILAFIGVKMLIAHYVKISTSFALFVIVFCVVFAMITSFAKHLTRPNIKY